MRDFTTVVVSVDFQVPIVTLTLMTAAQIHVSMESVLMVSTAMTATATRAIGEKNVKIQSSMKEV